MFNEVAGRLVFFWTFLEAWSFGLRSENLHCVIHQQLLLDDLMVFLLFAPKEVVLHCGFQNIDDYVTQVEKEEN